jgi:hypothetical protein
MWEATEIVRKMEGKSVLIYRVACHLATIPSYCSIVCDQDGARSGKGTLRVPSPLWTNHDMPGWSVYYVLV